MPFLYEDGDPMRWWVVLGAVPHWLVYLLGVIWALVFIRRCPGPAVCVLAASLLSLVSWVVLPFLLAWKHRQVFEYGDGWETFEVWLRAHAIVSGLLSAAIWALMLTASLGWRKRNIQSAPVAAAYAAGTDSFAPAPAATAAVPGTPPAAAPAMPQSFAPPPAAPISKVVFLGLTFGAFAFSMLLSIPGLVLIYGSRDEDVQIAGALLSCGSVFPSILGVVLLVVLLYKLWAALPPHYARTTPGKAIGFLFIPFFNFYWVFQAFWGWAKDHNRAADALGLAPHRASEGLALAICIVAVASVVPFVGIFLGLINLVLMPIFFNGAINGANALIAARTGNAATA